MANLSTQRLVDGWTTNIPLLSPRCALCNQQPRCSCLVSIFFISFFFLVTAAGKGLLNRTPSVAFDCLEGTLASRPTGWKARVGGTQLSGISAYRPSLSKLGWQRGNMMKDGWVSLRPVNLVLFRDCSNVFTAKFWPVSSVQHATHDDSH